MTTTVLFTILTEIQLCNVILIVKNPELSTTKLFLNVKMFKIRKIDEYTCELELTAYKNMKVIENYREKPEKKVEEQTQTLMVF